MKTKPFAVAPSSRYVKVSNIVFDEVLPNCTLAEQSVLMFILRRTAGFNKAEDKLSYNQIGEGTGIKGRATISTALKGLLDKGIITQHGERRGSMWYGLNRDFEIETSSKSELDDTPSSSETKLDDTEPSSKSELDSETPESHLVQNLNYASSKSELDESQLVQKLNTSKDMSFKDNTTTKLSNDNLDADGDPPDFSEILSWPISKIKKAKLKIEVDGWQALVALETKGKNRQSLLEFFDSRINAPPAAVEAWRSVTHRYPPKEKFAEIAEAVGDSEAGLSRWRQTVVDYISNGWNPANVNNQLEIFKSGGDPKDMANGQHNQSSARNSTTKTGYSTKAQPGSPGPGPGIGSGQTAEQRARLRKAFGQ